MTASSTEENDLYWREDRRRKRLQRDLARQSTKTMIWIIVVIVALFLGFFGLVSVAFSAAEHRETLRQQEERLKLPIPMT